jgi:hypothetical protein
VATRECTRGGHRCPPLLRTSGDAGGQLAAAAEEGLQFSVMTTPGLPD